MSEKINLSVEKQVVDLLLEGLDALNQQPGTKLQSSAMLIQVAQDISQQAQSQVQPADEPPADDPPINGQAKGKKRTPAATR